MFVIVRANAVRVIRTTLRTILLKKSINFADFLFEVKHKSNWEYLSGVKNDMLIINNTSRYLQCQLH